MDVGFYLGELLMQQGEVSVPGLGYFVQARVSGYYDENERKFYPPYHRAQFDAQSIDDDSLAEYIAVKKNISVASAKYFAEKYITNLKQQALLSEVPIGNLGSFYTEFGQLTFRPAEKIIDDIVFYGLEPISINKTDAAPVEERPKVELNYPPPVPPKPVITDDVADDLPPAEPVRETISSPAADEQEAGISPEFFDPEGEEAEARRGPWRLILIVLITMAVIGVGVFALYTYQPDTFARMVFWKPKAKVIDSVKPKDTLKAIVADTLKSDSLKADTTGVKEDTVAKTTLGTKKEQVISVQPAAKTKKEDLIVTRSIPAPAKTTPAKPGAAGAAAVKQSAATGTHRFEVYAGDCRTMTEVVQLIKRLKKNGLDAWLVPDGTGPLYHVSVGYFATHLEAKDFASKAIEAGKIPRGNAYAIEITPKTQAIVASTVPNQTAPAKPKIIKNSAGVRQSDATGTRRFEVYAGDCRTMAEVIQLIKKLKKNGLDAWLVPDGTGPLYHVSVGHFATRQEAKDFAFKAIEANKIPSGDAYPIEIIPQK
ncbi:SPOR domain-containing protein [Mucilaginibacter sp. UR6-11]|uniref:SPOR domain-containing protein n=1 Tax=Mucilaginibacter sp. UR6-11 TaxID=1435644 RepID=UPI001E5E2C07|nr:SPOR domain-containing protein [Mucilaginibacter sp. UR6-11]MCC8425669.1 SPOR domain-containing protein [Mucilaginibacter sp. UR6-11]